MRTSVLCCAAFAITLLAGSSARACDPVLNECLPAVVVYPAFTPEGIRVGTVEARVQRFIPFERSRFTGLPITVVYNDPARVPGTIDPELTLVPLSRTKHSITRFVYLTSHKHRLYANHQRCRT